ncbi:hypothetical protein SpCBS45565_g06114 [Spizellomyces sp. 'palustris']|nr:hypothetical protein SpCBS45565_g06114 [Spizellomyces sp. 'palustris']
MRPLILNCPPGFDSTILEPILSPFLRSLMSKLDREWRELVERGIRLTNEEAEEATDMSDDIIAEKMLRDVTRAYVDLIAALLAPATPAAKKKEENTANLLKQSFQNPDLVRFLLWDEAISGPLLSSITHLVTYKDTQTSRKAAVTCSKLLPVLVGHYEFHVWLGKDLLMCLLEALHDPYHQEIHSDIISTIADVYVRLRPVSMLPYETFGSLPGMNVDSLKAFEESLAKKSSAKEQNAIVKGFLQSITGIAISQQGKKQESFVLNIPEKQLMTRQPRQSRDEDHEGEAANEWFSGLFDQGRR